MSADQLICSKMTRLRAGAAPRYMDLFAGCGGISLGFATAGFIPTASVENDPAAAASHGANFAKFSANAASAAHHLARDVTEQNAADVFHELGISGPVDNQVDILVGGPPCQAFARVGRAKLRERARERGDVTAESAFVHDGRVSLWKRYVSYIRETRPVAVLMENVPDIMNHSGVNVSELVADELTAEGYVVRYSLLNAAWYGVPQIRERMILIGIHRDADAEPRFPQPTHHLTVPSGYDGSRATALMVVKAKGAPHFRSIVGPEDGLTPATTVADALADLPKIFALDLHKSGLLRRGEKKPSQLCDYTSATPTTAWTRLMREWPKFGATTHTTGHVIRYLPRDYKVFAEMQQGWQYPNIHAAMEQKIAGFKRRRKARGLSDSEHDPDVIAYIKDWRLPYDPKKFPNKWWKMIASAPSRTLLAHLGKDSYSHIHYDSAQARTISIREAARLQSFPDGFVFQCSGNPALKQIGNAVPPLFAYAIAQAIRLCLGCSTISDIRCDLLGLPRRHIDTTAGTSCAS